MPVYDRHPTAQILNINEQLYLIDCGEGTQMQLQRYGIRFSKINHIFISHLHGDHYLGLVPFLDTLGLLGRTAPMHLYGPSDLIKVVQLHAQINGWETSITPYPLHFHPIDPNNSALLLEDKQITVHSIILDHRVPCTGFFFAEKTRDRKMLGDKIKTYSIPYQQIPAIKKGADFTTDSGEIISNEVLTLPPPLPLSYAFCSDTAYTESFLPLIEGVDLLYHEATYLEDYLEMAAPRGHSTAKQAALIAQKSNAKRLILGHFSSRYQELQPFLEEARTIFENTDLAIEGEVFEVKKR